MTTMPLIKVCGMREPDNIRNLVRLSPDFIGFIFYPKSKRYVGKRIDRKVLSLIPDHIQKVGVVVDESIEDLISLYKENHLDFLQLHGKESPELCTQLKDVEIQIIQAFSIDDSFDFSIIDEYEEACDYFLFDTKCDTKGGSGKKFNWKILDNYNLTKPFFLSGGISIDDVEEIILLKEKKSIYAVDINSRFEIEPALKDIGLIHEFIQKFK